MTSGSGGTTRTFVFGGPTTLGRAPGPQRPGSDGYVRTTHVLPCPLTPNAVYLGLCVEVADQEAERPQLPARFLVQ
jgi:hypothetical protein